jgi:hypothetical protein
MQFVFALSKEVTFIFCFCQTICLQVVFLLLLMSQNHQVYVTENTSYNYCLKKHLKTLTAKQLIKLYRYGHVLQCMKFLFILLLSACYAQQGGHWTCSQVGVGSIHGPGEISLY